MTNYVKDVEFLEDSHTYLYKGMIIPSVTQLIDLKFDKTYEGIPEETLREKAEYGNKVHHYVEQLLFKKMTLDEINSLNIDPNIKFSCQDALELTKKWMFDYESTEEIVCYKGKYAGTYDLKTSDGYIIDIKTTYELHLDNENLQAPLNYQISGYYLPLKKYMDKGYVMWLPKGRKGCIQEVVTWNKQEFEKDIKERIKEYEHNQQ